MLCFGWAHREKARSDLAGWPAERWGFLGRLFLQAQEWLRVSFVGLHGEGLLKGILTGGGWSPWVKLCPDMELDRLTRPLCAPGSCPIGGPDLL